MHWLRDNGNHCSLCDKKLVFMKISVFLKYIILFCTFFVLSIPFHLQAQVITTIADLNLQDGYSGDGGPAVYAKFGEPKGVAVDKSGNIYIADADNNRIRMIDAFGNVSTFAGTGKNGYNGDNILATKAELYYPSYIIFDNDDNAYIADTYNNRVRKIDHTTGIITTVAGNGILGYAGTNILATKAYLDYPVGLTFDSSGNLYVVSNVLVQKVDKETGIITTYAGSVGSGSTVDGGPATAADCTGITSAVFDSKGNMYISDWTFHIIWKVNPAGRITRYAGYANLGQGPTGDGGPASNARLNRPADLKVDLDDNLYVSDQDDGRIRKIDPSGIITTFAGNGSTVHSGDGSSSIDAGLCQPYGMTFDANGNLYFTETSNWSWQGSNDVRIIFGADLSNTSSQAMIYPNPTFNGVVRLFFPSKYADDINIVITNQAGQKVYENKFVTNLPIEVHLEPTGIYALQAKSRHGKWHGEISVVR